jgi:hypothetical protein
MKVTISESQFKRMVNNSNRWGLIGVSEGRGPALTPERIKRNSDYYELKHLGTIDGRTPNEEYKNTLYKEFGYPTVVDGFKEKNEDGTYNSDYRWLKINNKELFNKLRSRQKDFDKQQRSVNNKPKSNYYELKYLGTIDGIVPNEDEKKKFYTDYGETPDKIEDENNRPVKVSLTDYNWLNYNNKELLNKIVSVHTNRISEKDVRDNAKDFYFSEDFRVAFPSYWAYAERNDILKSLFPFEKERRAQKKRKEVNDSIKVAEKYLSISEFRKNHNAHYTNLLRAQKNIPEEFSGILDELFPNKSNESLGEKYIKDILTEMGIKFKYDKGDGVCKGPEIQRKGKNGLFHSFCPTLRFDFIIPNTIENKEIIENLPKDDTIPENGSGSSGSSGSSGKSGSSGTSGSTIPENGIIIEFDGEFHFFDKRTNRRENESFENDIIRDIIKNNYCLNNGIKLIRIPYTSRDKGREKVKEDIIHGFKSTKPIVLTGNYPKAGWNK